jgi:hypothetical protein
MKPRAQQSTVPVIGFLRSTTAAGSEHLAAAFEQGLKDAGFVEGQNVAIDYHWGNDQSDWLAGLAADLIRRQPGVSAAGPGSTPRPICGRRVAAQPNCAKVQIAFGTNEVFDSDRHGIAR